MGLEVRRERFLLGNITYPLSLVAFEKKNMLGFFDPHNYQIGLHKRLIYQAKSSVIKDILRHEMAHYMDFIENKALLHPHGSKFKAICSRYGWGANISSATCDIEMENQKREGELEQERILSKVSKLLSLTSSDNVYESKLAWTKANRLLLMHNLQEISLLPGNDEILSYCQRVLQNSRYSSKLGAIYEILKSFYVAPVLSYGQEGVYLEVVGSKVNVETAEYIAGHLDYELERLWTLARKSNPELKGSAKKNSFFVGVAKGFNQKMQQIQSSEFNKSDLLPIINQTELHLQQAYPRLSRSSGQRSGHCHMAEGLGREAGTSIQIKKSIKQSSQNPLLLS